MSHFPEEPLNLTSSEGFGYFPAYQGQQLKKGRYKIIRKVGYGLRSSAWLVLAPWCVIGLSEEMVFLLVFSGIMRSTISLSKY
jgi:hypothetical protein